MYQYICWHALHEGFLSLAYLHIQQVLFQFFGIHGMDQLHTTMFVYREYENMTSKQSQREVTTIWQRHVTNYDNMAAFYVCSSPPNIVYIVFLNQSSLSRWFPLYINIFPIVIGFCWSSKNQVDWFKLRGFASLKPPSVGQGIFEASVSIRWYT